MNFEYDEYKSKLNQLKHGIDFEEAKALWEDPYTFELKSNYAQPRSQSYLDQGEDRFLVLGRIKSKNYTAIITYRNNSTRIISVRRSRKEEIKLYESIRNR